MRWYVSDERNCENHLRIYSVQFTSRPLFTCKCLQHPFYPLFFPLRLQTASAARVRLRETLGSDSRFMPLDSFHIFRLQLSSNDSPRFKRFTSSSVLSFSLAFVCVCVCSCSSRSAMLPFVQQQIYRAQYEIDSLPLMSEAEPTLQKLLDECQLQNSVRENGKKYQSKPKRTKCKSIE